MEDKYKNTLERIQNKKAKIGLIGIGYVGEAIGMGAAIEGYEVIGYSRTKEKVDAFNTKKITSFIATNSYEDLMECDIVCICVPTPVHEDKTPDLGPVIDATNNLSKILRKGMLVILESSVASGTTRNVVFPILEMRGLRVEEDYFLAFSPERIDPGNSKFQFSNIPKVVSGYGEKSLKLADEFYKRIVISTHTVSSFETAEMSKLLENTFRLINISLINELAEYTRRIGVDIFEVIHAANTKPFGFMPHYPGPGIGGHCIPVDPHYLREDAQKKGVRLRMIEAAEEINRSRKSIVVRQAIEIIKRTNGKKRAHKALIVGVAYKADVADTRESPAIPIWKELLQNGVDVIYHDPLIPSIDGVRSSELTLDTLESVDVVILVTHHSSINYPLIQIAQTPVLDTRNYLKQDPENHIYRLSQIPF